jgi:hypothetical protein
MKKYFNRLNEDDHNNSEITEINYDILNDYLKNELITKMSKLNPPLKIFNKIPYRSNILSKLSNEGISIETAGREIDTSKFLYTINSSTFKRFMEEFEYTRMICVNEIISRMGDLDSCSEKTYNILYHTILDHIGLNFLNKNKDTDEYYTGSVGTYTQLIRKNDVFDIKKYVILTYRYKYIVKNKYNKFHITEYTRVSKEHIIEYNRKLSGVYIHSDKDVHVSLYSGYFDDI